MIHVIAVITAKPGQLEHILEAFRGNVASVRAEHGCLEYAAAVDLDDGPVFQTRYGPDTLVVVEKWENMEALKAHAAAPHMAAYSARIRENVASRAIHVLSPV